MAYVTHFRIKIVDADAGQDIATLDLREYNDLQTIDDDVDFAAAIRQAIDDYEAPISEEEQQ